MESVSVSFKFYFVEFIIIILLILAVQSILVNTDTIESVRSKRVH